VIKSVLDIEELKRLCDSMIVNPWIATTQDIRIVTINYIDGVTLNDFLNLTKM
jgi:hypothetical protein